LGVKIEGAVTPVSEFVDWLFPGENRPVLPGIVFFDRLVADVGTAVYVPLTGLGGQGVTRGAASCFRLRGGV